MRLDRITPGTRPPASLAGAVLSRDLVVAGERWDKGRVLTAADLDALAAAAPPEPGTRDHTRASRGVTVICPDPDELHEDAAALRLADAVTGGVAGLVRRGPRESRVDLLAEADGVVDVRIGALARLNAIDPLEVFTLFDGQVVAAGDLVASVKVGPHVVPRTAVEAGERVAARGGPVVRVRPFRPITIGVIVKETIDGTARARFEASVGAKAAGLGARLAPIRYVADDPEAVAAAVAAARHGPDRADLILTAGGASTDPADAFYVAMERLGGTIVRHGVPSHPGSMVWLGRIGRTAVVGLPSCGAFSKATAADLLLPRLVAGQPASAVTVARLGHGGILTRSQRFRFPPYARSLDAPDG